MVAWSRRAAFGKAIRASLWYPSTSISLKEALIKSHMRDRSAFVPCVPVPAIRRRSTHTLRTSIGTKALPSLVRDEFYWVASGAASATLRALPRYLPWLRRDASHPSAPDATRVARLNQRFLKSQHRDTEGTEVHGVRASDDLKPPLCFWVI